MFNFIDVIIVLVVLLQVIRWTKSGFLRGFFPLVGFLGGLLIGSWLAPSLVEYASNPLGRLGITLAALVGLALIGNIIGEIIGHYLADANKKIKLGGKVDSILGAVFSAGMTLFIIWMLSALIVAAPFQNANQHIRGSAVLQTLNEHLPPAPEALSRIANLIEPGGFPQVFTGLEPRPIEPVDLPDSPEVKAAVKAAGSSTVRIESLGCGGIVNGSGFVAAPDTVITNAHVVAGITNPTIVDKNGTHRATVVHFDPKQDIAVLKTEDLAGKPLELADKIMDRGTTGAALGYPGGGRLDASPSGVTRQLQATGRDIYGRSVVVRSIYELQTEIKSGNSGGPVVTSDGTVIGMVFARSTANTGRGYAIISPELKPIVTQHQDATSSVTTGECTN